MGKDRDGAFLHVFHIDLISHDIDNWILGFWIPIRWIGPFKPKTWRANWYRLTAYPTDTQHWDVLFTRILDGLNFPSVPRWPKPPGTMIPSHLHEFCHVISSHIIGIDPINLDFCIVGVPWVLQGLNDRNVGILQFYVFSNQEILTCFWGSWPCRPSQTILSYLLQEHPLQMVTNDLVHILCLQVQWIWYKCSTSSDDDSFCKSPELSQLVLNSLTSWLFCTDDQHIWLNPKTTSSFTRVLRRLGFISPQLSSKGRRVVWIHNIFSTRHLPSFDEELQGMEGTQYLQLFLRLLWWWHLRIRRRRCSFDLFFQGICNMRNNLYSRAQVFSATFLAKDFAINFPVVTFEYLFRLISMKRS